MAYQGYSGVVDGTRRERPGVHRRSGVTCVWDTGVCFPVLERLRVRSLRTSLSAYQTLVYYVNTSGGQHCKRVPDTRRFDRDLARARSPGGLGSPRLSLRLGLSLCCGGPARSSTTTLRSRRHPGTPLERRRLSKTSTYVPSLYSVASPSSGASLRSHEPSLGRRW